MSDDGSLSNHSDISGSPRSPSSTQKSDDDSAAAYYSDERADVESGAQRPLSDTNVDSILLRIAVSHISDVSSRWMTTSTRKGSNVVDKHPRLKLSLQV